MSAIVASGEQHQSNKFLRYNPESAKDIVDRLHHDGFHSPSLGPSDSYRLQNWNDVLGTKPGVKAMELLRKQAEASRHGRKPPKGPLGAI